MICFTNHALDQFLESCIDICQLREGVVRVGGRSKNAALNGFLLSNIKEEMPRAQSSLRTAIRNETENFEKLKKDMSRVNSLLRLLFDGCAVLNYKTLEPYMDKALQTHFSKQVQFIAYKYKLEEHETALNAAVLDWLGLFSISGHVEAGMMAKFSKLKFAEPRADGKEEEPSLDSMYDERMVEDDFASCAELGRSSAAARSSAHDRDCIGFETIDRMRCQFTGDDDWQTKHARGKTRAELSKTRAHLCQLFAATVHSNTLLDANNNNSSSSLQIVQRFQLYLGWLTKFAEAKQSEIAASSRQFTESAMRLRELRMQEDASIMENACIIAMTTTGASRYHSALKKIGPRIVIVEEAAEVFEAHVIAGLSKACEHLILIGDHKQLRPNPVGFSSNVLVD
jgi:hypothetical protein